MKRLRTWGRRRRVASARASNHRARTGTSCPKGPTSDCVARRLGRLQAVAGSLLAVSFTGSFDVSTTRRDFLRITAAQGVALVVTIPSVGCRTAARPEPLSANQWIEVDGKGVVTLVLDKSEMGQGVSTALPMIMAEELGADWERVRVVQARPGLRFTAMGTSGSGSVSTAWRSHRTAAAAVRTMLVSSAATEWSVAPDECFTAGGEVRHRGSSRRAAFGDLIAAARLLPVPENPPFKEPGEYTLLGTAVPDPSLREIVTGRVTFGIDMTIPGMLHAVIARSPEHGGTLRRFDAERSLAVPGVRQVVQVPSGIAIVANSTWAAIKGREALDVEWSPGPNAGFDNERAWRVLDEAWQRGGKVARSSGSAQRALARAARRIEALYRWTWQAHAAIEPLSAVARVTSDGCEVWAGMQNPNGAQARVAEALGIPPERVTVNVLRLGGAFGRRIASDFIVEAALVSRGAAAPVQVLWTREDDFRHDMYNPAQVNRLAAAVDGRGVVTGWLHQVADFHLSMFGEFNPGADPAADGDPWGGFDSPYEVSDLRVELALAESPVPSGAWRAVTYPAAVLARECFIDEIAHATGADPIALRRTMLPRAGAASGATAVNGDRLRNVLQVAAERAGWGTVPGAVDGRRMGRGIACNPYHRGTMVAQVADVSVGPDGDIRVHRVVSAVDCGRVINRAGVEKQVEGGVGWALSALLGPGVRFEGGRTVTASFGEYPVLRFGDMPTIETHLVEGATRPFGMGEPPVPAVAPAVLNAVFAATGVRLRTLPLATELLALR